MKKPKQLKFNQKNQQKVENPIKQEKTEIRQIKFLQELKIPDDTKIEIKKPTTHL